ncbi:hypothetical protein GCM10009021_25420 [Halarchaeum nitratireducens]|uniref:Peptidase S54 rhomboid domain-containing protein n=1 Tax=Halarchaeum nitratireducens TaxID=489913 RepID=A0A830GDR9_9EURY|nr:hypothetical protein GCM10009021_25420 [Halarchaeum nitratireducens]
MRDVLGFAPAVSDVSRPPDTGASVLIVLHERGRLRDAVALAVVPVALVGVFALPASLRSSLVFSYREPTLVTAYGANVVHFRLAHLLADVVGYVLLAGTGYVLAVLAERRHLFLASALTYLVAFPPILSALNLAVPRNAVTYGFSGVVAAFAGFVPLALATYAKHRLSAGAWVRQAPGVFLASLVVVVAVALPDSRVAMGATAFVVSATALYGVSTLRRGLITTLARSVRDRRGWGDCFLLGVVVVFGFPFAGFPQPRVGGSVVNLYVHLLGYCLAFLVPYVALQTDAFARMPEPRSS